MNIIKCRDVLDYYFLDHLILIVSNPCYQFLHIILVCLLYLFSKNCVISILIFALFVYLKIKFSWDRPTSFIWNKYTVSQKTTHSTFNRNLSKYFFLILSLTDSKRKFLRICARQFHLTSNVLQNRTFKITAELLLPYHQKESVLFFQTHCTIIGINKQTFVWDQNCTNWGNSRDLF